MRATFSRMKPVETNMVEQARNDYTGLVDLLCVECGWEDNCHPIDTNTRFLAHSCRIVTESVSRLD